jgi:transcriptional regulator with XRE-family HTH domain
VKVVPAKPKRRRRLRSLAEQAGILLADFRLAAGFSRRDMARKLGVADTTLLELEAGRANPTVGRLEKVAKAYGIELELGHRDDGR